MALGLRAVGAHLSRIVLRLNADALTGIKPQLGLQIWQLGQKSENEAPLSSSGQSRYSTAAAVCHSLGARHSTLSWYWASSRFRTESRDASEPSLGRARFAF